MSMRILKFCIANLLVLLCVSSIYAVSVIPGEQGFGMETPAGRGGEIYKVTNLNPSGSGSLKECIDAEGSRYCVFEVSGTIELEDHLKITNPDITIAGQTAPSPGITIKGAGIVVQASDVLIQHIRVRVGDESEGPAYDDRDAIKIEAKYGSVKNVVIDHVSASWAMDETFSTWSYDGKYAKDITVTNSLFGEALYDSKHPDGKHSMGVLIGKNTRDLLFSKNILAYNNYRNPLIRDDVTDVIVANNYIHNPGVGSKSKIYFGTKGDKNVPMRATVVGNVFTPNPDEYYDNVVYVEDGSPSSFSLYVKDNLGPLGTSSPWDAVMGRTDSSVKESSPPVTAPGLSYMSSSKVKKYVFENVGARPADRDDVDKRIIENMKSGKGGIIDSPKDVGGWPNLEKNTRKVIIPANPHGDDDGDGYTNFEEVLHQYAAEVEGRSSNSDSLDLSADDDLVDSDEDNTPPVISENNPSTLPAGTTSYTLKLTTDENAYCHYDTRPDIHYLDQQVFCDGTGTKSHSSEISGLNDGETYTYYVRCKDLSYPHNYNMEDYEITIRVEDKVVEENSDPSSGGADTAPPVISDSVPNTLPSGTTSLNLKVETDEKAYCHYDTRPDIHYLDQKYFFDGKLTQTHTATVDNLKDGETYTYYVRCKDLSEPRNYNMVDYIIKFRVDEEVVEESDSIEVDKEPPVISDTIPNTLESGTTSLTLEVETDEKAYCHYDTRPDIHYLDQRHFFDGKLTKTHTATVDNLKDGETYTYYVRCKDLSEPRNYNMEDYVISFIINSEEDDVNIDESSTVSLSPYEPDVNLGDEINEDSLIDGNEEESPGDASANSSFEENYKIYLSEYRGYFMN